MHLNFSLDSSVGGAPQGFTNVLNQVASFFDTTFLDPITVNIAVGWGEVAGHTLPSGAAGSSSFSVNAYSYSQIKAALAADAKSPIDASAVASLPAINPTGGTYLLSSAHAKALGMPNSSSLDGSVGFAARTYDFDNSNGVDSGQLDFFGVVAHEVTEVMGRFLLVGQNGYALEDLFHFSSPGVRIFSGGQAGYFSADNGMTNLGTFNTNASGDFGDWANAVGPDSFRAFAPSGALLPISTNDLKVMDALGYDLSASTQSSPPSDAAPPILSSTSPADNSTNVVSGTNLVLNFDEGVKAGSGNVVVHEASNGSAAATISVNDPNQVNFSGSTVTINPTSDLAVSTHYYLTIDTGAIQDLAGNAFGGISNSTEFDFTTASPSTPVSGPMNPFTPFRPIAGFNPFLPFTPSDPTTPSSPTVPTAPSSPFVPFKPIAFNPFSPFGSPLFATEKFDFSAHRVTGDSHISHSVATAFDAGTHQGSDFIGENIGEIMTHNAEGPGASVDSHHSNIHHFLGFYDAAGF